jgi:hypothetical protein
MAAQKNKVNYQNQKEHIQVTADTADFNTACTNISFENRGTEAVNLVLANGRGTYPLAAGTSVAFNNPPDVMENNRYKIVFGNTGGTKLLVITREHVYRVLGGESVALPSRSLGPVQIPDNSNNA